MARRPKYVRPAPTLVGHFSSHDPPPNEALIERIEKALPSIALPEARREAATELARFAEGTRKIRDYRSSYEASRGDVRPTVADLRKRVAALREAMEGLPPNIWRALFRNSRDAAPLSAFLAGLRWMEWRADAFLKKWPRQRTRQPEGYELDRAGLTPEQNVARILCEILAQHEVKGRAATKCLQIVFQVGLQRVLSDDTAAKYLKQGRARNRNAD